MAQSKKKSGAPSRRNQVQDYATPTRKLAAEKVNAVSSLQKAARRCARSLGGNCLPGLLDIVRKEVRGER